MDKFDKLKDYFSDEKYFKNKKKNYDPILLCELSFIIFIIILSFVLPEHLSENKLEMNMFPSSEHLFGTDDLGRDIFFRTIKGTKISMIIAISGGLIELFIGGGYGAIAGYVGGKTEYFMMRILDIFSSIPYLVLVTLIPIFLGRNLFGIIVAITFTGWFSSARIIRGEVLHLKEENYVKASKLMGASTFSVIKNHIFPNIIGILSASVIMNIPKYIFAEAFLQILGLGLGYPNITWGMLISGSQENLFFYPYQIVFPSIVLVTVIFIITHMGERIKKLINGHRLHWRGYYG
ncbi:ABC transporter permease [uncultured Ilyobacter sp.]|uniref:ABC transporter permease n=1 Tax=uncultured Ilyobacter sp. TaxID=544433 RepID=UPI0029C8F0D4|nr:ABC transporter permease [uncultured Ilyobacter sp.]